MYSCSDVFVHGKTFGELEVVVVRMIKLSHLKWKVEFVEFQVGVMEETEKKRYGGQVEQELLFHFLLFERRSISPARVFRFS